MARKVAPVDVADAMRQRAALEGLYQARIEVGDCVRTRDMHAGPFVVLAVGGKGKDRVACVAPWPHDIPVPASGEWYSTGVLTFSEPTFSPIGLRIGDEEE